MGDTARKVNGRAASDCLSSDKKYFCMHAINNQMSCVSHQMHHLKSVCLLYTASLTICKAMH